MLQLLVALNLLLNAKSCIWNAWNACDVQWSLPFTPMIIGYLFFYTFCEPFPQNTLSLKKTEGPLFVETALSAGKWAFTLSFAYQVSGVITDTNSKARWIVQGTWDEKMEGAKVLNTVEKSSGKLIYETGEPKMMWQRRYPLYVSCMLASRDLSHSVKLNDIPAEILHRRCHASIHMPWFCFRLYFAYALCGEIQGNISLNMWLNVN